MADLKSKLTYIDILFITLMVLGLMLLGYGVFHYFSQPKAQVEYLSGNDSGSSDQNIWVEVSGAVEIPGVYQLNDGSRIKDALAKAGGLGAKADRDYVSRTLNLVDKLKDGQKVYIPEAAEAIQTSGGVIKTANVSRLININTASESELDGLWGVGEARAKAIIDNRPYRDVQDLVSKGVMPKNVLDKNKDKISVY